MVWGLDIHHHHHHHHHHRCHMEQKLLQKGSSRKRHLPRRESTSAMFRPDIENILVLTECSRILDTDILAHQRQGSSCPCPRCGAQWPQQRLLLAREGYKATRPFRRTVRFCTCDLWTPTATSSATFQAEVLAMRAYLADVYSRVDSRLLR